ncbi:activating transcription factor 7-interacting protein 1 isoform X1 [Astyanax mexicanus]|uniref:activating transcription factor 7-interacting protein 1 isoform X1 n=1 Tax=Astyanax mexicanus TaxID=7994 RepID=UPI0020CB38CB|nr:activating transcription factor 7-interacting protein 1 isoform X1 [Astyanax mexicanus]XP_049325338.1 activating transcription factor 7-interacting protein 1 isoform X1 [Astyanax mexicanus]XP_049325339.1 activating transcription factor 7-interacting protein 1 isoform X1 [Astyanax mexicanus]XP_049325340.1 activating transcription factor 7-interacting protein 1 isoform X1 [Astyanax mexicanus]XP_049325341.1 activating transcription factor 7-interacting protein 1 isoform X1 [Astyanax mexicanus]
MEVAVPEEPQKKIFRARKTMKMSDRQQLEALHGTLTSAASNSSASSSPSSSSRPQTPLMNGTHVEDGENVKEKEKDWPPSSRSPSPSVKDVADSEQEKGQSERKEEAKPEEAEVDKMEASTSDQNDPKTTSSDQLFNGETAPMDEDSPSPDNAPVEEKEEKSVKSSSSSVSGSPATNMDCDPEVKEGFLFLSEEDEGQGERDESKTEKSEVKKEADAVKEEKKEVAEPSQACKTADGTGNSTPAGKKRSFSPEGEKDGLKAEVKEERDGKRARVDGVELEAQLELKITAKAGSRMKLEKVVQQLVEDRLRVLQLTVFDRNLKELKERVDKIDNTTKQQNALQHITTLQAKISRLAKKFGAANQASENYKKAQETPAAKTTATHTISSTQRTMLDPKHHSAPAGTSSMATPTQPKPFSTPTTATSSALAASAPILQILTTAPGSTPSSSTSSLAGQTQTGTLLLQTRPNQGVMTTSSGTSGNQPMSIQLIQVPLAMANGQAGTLAGGVGLIPVSSLANVNSLNKTKTTTPTTTIILQKSAGNVVSSSSPLLSSTAPQMSLGRSMYQGGSGTVSSPSAAVSVTTARTPTQCAPVVGVATASSSPATTGPAATGSAAAAATGPSSASAMTSKTDNQASAPAKSPSQSGRPKSSFIDLTEDDDDVQVTGVQKASAPSNATSTQRPSGPPPLVSTATVAGRSGVQHRPSVDSPSRSRPGSSSSAPLPPLPLAPTPPTRLPPEAAHTSPPQQPQLKLARVQSQNGIVLSWCVAETDRNCAAVDSYHLYAYHQDHQGAAATVSSQLWKKIGEVKALPLPMACTLTQFVSGSTYYFAVRAKDVYGRFGPFCEPQCTDVINPPSSS